MPRVLALCLLTLLLPAAAGCTGVGVGDGAGGTTLAQSSPESPGPRRIQYAARSDTEVPLSDAQLFGISDSEVDAEEGDEASDPLEILNRFVFAFNETLDVFIIRPAAVVYRDAVPDPIKTSVRSFFRNLGEPLNFMNALFQGDAARADTIASRFMINSILTLGFYDYAAELGHPYHPEDFGQTLGSYGVGPGPYLVLPLLGPSTFRDAAGRGVDAFLSPWGFVMPQDQARELSVVQAGVLGLDYRMRNIETLDALQADSLDFYARIRSLYLQTRAREVNNTDTPDDDSTVGTPAMMEGPTASTTVGTTLNSLPASANPLR